jgi:hypothetical protein
MAISTKRAPVTLGSLQLTSDRTSPLSQLQALGYCSSKSALNAVTVQFANELRQTPLRSMPSAQATSPRTSIIIAAPALQSRVRALPSRWPRFRPMGLPAATSMTTGAFPGESEITRESKLRST